MTEGSDSRQFCCVCVYVCVRACLRACVRVCVLEFSLGVYFHETQSMMKLVFSMQINIECINETENCKLWSVPLSVFSSLCRVHVLQATLERAPVYFSLNDPQQGYLGVAITK